MVAINETNGPNLGADLELATLTGDLQILHQRDVITSFEDVAVGIGHNGRAVVDPLMPAHAALETVAGFENVCHRADRAGFAVVHGDVCTPSFGGVEPVGGIFDPSCRG